MLRVNSWWSTYHWVRHPVVNEASCLVSWYTHVHQGVSIGWGLYEQETIAKLDTAKLLKHICFIWIERSENLLSWRVMYLFKSQLVNSLAPGRFKVNFRWVIFMLILVVNGWGISCETVLLWVSLDYTDDESTLVQVMAWCRQATSHYLSQCWPRSLLPYGFTRPTYLHIKWLQLAQEPQETGLLVVFCGSVHSLLKCWSFGMGLLKPEKNNGKYTQIWHTTFLSLSFPLILSFYLSLSKKVPTLFTSNNYQGPLTLRN